MTGNFHNSCGHYVARGTLLYSRWNFVLNILRMRMWAAHVLLVICKYRSRNTTKYPYRSSTLAERRTWYICLDAVVHEKCCYCEIFFAQYRLSPSSIELCILGWLLCIHIGIPFNSNLPPVLYTGQAKLANVNLSMHYTLLNTTKENRRYVMMGRFVLSLGTAFNCLQDQSQVSYSLVIASSFSSVPRFKVRFRSIQFHV